VEVDSKTTLSFYGELHTPPSIVRALFSRDEFFGAKLPAKTVEEVLDVELFLRRDTRAPLVYVSVIVQKIIGVRSMSADE
jgi:hypothetical protein